jgi:hypothetical protein
MYAKANPVRCSSPVDDLKYDFRYFSIENVRSAVAVDTGRVAKQDMQQRVNCELPDRMFCRTYAEHSLIQSYDG